MASKVGLFCGMQIVKCQRGAGGDVYVPVARKTESYSCKFKYCVKKRGDVVSDRMYTYKGFGRRGGGWRGGWLGNNWNNRRGVG